MKIEIDFTDELTNTQYAPLAAFLHITKQITH